MADDTQGGAAPNLDGTDDARSGHRCIDTCNLVTLHQGGRCTGQHEQQDERQPG